MRKLLFSLIMLLIAGAGFAQTIEGTWYGALNVQTTTLHLVFHISKSLKGYTSTFDSPDQGASGLATDKTTFTGNQLTIVASKFGIIYTGKFLPDSTKITGMFKQGMASFPLNLLKNRSITALVPAFRPQDPKDFPYRQEEVYFTNTKAGDQLAGTLTLPQGGKVAKIVVLITGSGPQNRNEELMNHRPFLVWSDWLTRNGIAVLRYDDRGIGQSTGDFNTATTADFADDVEAAVRYIQSRPDLKGLSIGLMGHSEGGLIAPMVASRNKAVKFMILLAAPGVPIIDLMTMQTADQTRLSGASAEMVNLNTATSRIMYEGAIKYSTLSIDDFKARLYPVLYQQLRNYPNTLADSSKLATALTQSIAAINTLWFRYFIAINPADYLTKIKCPVLALNGTLDMQVNSSANLAGIKADLQKAGNKNHQEIAMSGLNHLFQQATTGAVSEYVKSEETVNPAALQKVSVWVSRLR